MWNERLKEIVKRLPPTHSGVVVWDDYNQRFSQDQDVIGTITTNIGSSAPRNGIKIIEVYETERVQIPTIPTRSKSGGVLDIEICPTISCSSWENNCFLIEIYGQETDDPTPKSGGGKSRTVV